MLQLGTGTPSSIIILLLVKTVLEALVERITNCVLLENNTQVKTFFMSRKKNDIEKIKNKVRKVNKFQMCKKCQYETFAFW